MNRDADMRAAVDERVAARIENAKRRRQRLAELARLKNQRRAAGLRARHAAKLDRLQREANDMDELSKAESAIEDVRAALADAKAARPGPERVRALELVTAATTRAEAAIEGLAAVERSDEGTASRAWPGGDDEIIRTAS